MSLFVESKESDMKLLFKLYRTIKDGLKPVAELYKSFLVRQGQSLVENCETHQDGKPLALREIVANSGLIEHFISLMQKQTRIIKECFEQDPMFDRQLQLAFQVFVNLDVGQFSMAEMLSSYIDKLLRKGAISDNFDEMVDSLVTVFTHLDNKDLFLEVYRNQLARRLLMDKCADIDSEKRLITNLKVTCGLQQLNKIQGMINDLQHAKDITAAYNDFRAKQPQTLDFSC